MRCGRRHDYGRGTERRYSKWMTGRTLPPTPPREPDAGDCCGEGCLNCVFDVYEARLERYRAALEQWRQGQEGGEDEGQTPPAPPPS